MPSRKKVKDNEEVEIGAKGKRTKGLKELTARFPVCSPK